MIARTRSQHFARSLTAGYLFIGANVAYTVFSIPLALRYLGKEEFGLWALAMQISSYLLLLDLGVTSAISRFLADSKDNPEGPVYAAVFRAGCTVLALQGLIVAALGAGFSLFAPFLFGVPETLARDFSNILFILSVISGLSIATRTVSAPLWAYQRQDINYLMGIVNLLSSLLFLWVGFAAGWGIYSFAVAGVPALLVCPLISFLICYGNGYYPTRWSAGCVDVALIRRIFRFGKDVLLMTLGSQVVNASQIMILSRFASLEAAATFAIGTKLFALGQQFSGRVFESSAPSLTEIYVRGEEPLFRERFREILGLSGFLAVVSALVLVCTNSKIVFIWTAGKITWEPVADLLLALLLVFTTATRCIVGLFGVIARLQPVRAVYFLEACVFIALAIPASQRFGTVGILTASLLAHAAVTAFLPVRAAILHAGDDGGFLRTLLVSTSIVIAVFLAGPLWMGTAKITVYSVLVAAAGLVIGATAAWWLLLTSETRRRMFAKFPGLPHFVEK